MSVGGQERRGDADNGGVSADTPAAALDPDLVRCLACRTVYSKPVDAREGEGSACPDCGYVGWLSVLIPVPPDVRSTAAPDAA